MKLVKWGTRYDFFLGRDYIPIGTQKFGSSIKVYIQIISTHFTTLILRKV